MEEQEINATHAPLLSAAYFIQEHCRDYNDDFMLCKRDNQNPAACEKEGRRVLRCTKSFLKQMDAACKETYDAHWKCLQEGNNYYWRCRTEEKAYNGCVFKKFGYKKTIPDAPDYEIPIHMRDDVYYKK